MKARGQEKPLNTKAETLFLITVAFPTPRV